MQAADTLVSSILNRTRPASVPPHLCSEPPLSQGGTLRSVHRSSANEQPYCSLTGTSVSVRASGASSHSLMFRRVARSIRRHWSIGTTTAVSTPRWVTIWGPSAKALPEQLAESCLRLLHLPCSSHRILPRFGSDPRICLGALLKSRVQRRFAESVRAGGRPPVACVVLARCRLSGTGSAAPSTPCEVRWRIGGGRC